MVTKILKPYEPYNLTEIEKIIQKAKERSEKQDIEDKIRDYQIVLEKIDFTISNSSPAFDYLMRERLIDDVDNYNDELEKAKISRERFRIEIAELVSAGLSKSYSENGILHISTKSGGSSEQNGIPSAEETASSKDKTNEYMTTEQVAEYLQLSVFTIYHKAEKGYIPAHKSEGNTYTFIRSEIDEWVRNGKPKCQQSGETTKKHHFVWW